MSVSTQLEYADLDELHLDPQNPRLGRSRVAKSTPQESLLDWMRDFTLDELALSYLANGSFWTHEALLVVDESIGDDSGLVVVEGNRRLAALKYLKRAVDGGDVPAKWKKMVSEHEIPPDLFTKVPYLKADSRRDIQAFLGFRHVTGIKQWDADEKASFIAHLIEDEGLSYDEVMRKIGSNTPTVRKHYIAYRLLVQIEDTDEDFESEWAENRFALLYMTVSTEGAQKYLHIDINAEPGVAQRPVPEDHQQNLKNFARWLFGTDEEEPLLKDTRQVGKFGSVLKNPDAVEYLETKSRPVLEIANRIAGGDLEEIVEYITEAASQMELALTRAHAYKDSKQLKAAVERAAGDALQLLSLFPDLKSKLIQSEQ